MAFNYESQIFHGVISQFRSTPNQSKKVIAPDEVANNGDLFYSTLEQEDKM